MWANCSGMEIVIFLTLKYFVQVAHLALLANFPFFSVSSPSFIMAIVMVFVNHYFAFSYFGENYYPFSEVIIISITDVRTNK